MKKNKIFILGGSGLIGSSIVKLYNQRGIFVNILDIKNNNKNNNKNNFIKFDCKNEKNLNINLKKIYKKYGIPEIFINCSYPVGKDWAKSSIANINYSNFKKNLNMHLNSYVWTAKITAESMKNNKSGSILLLGSIYGPLAQDTNLYKNTKIKDNFTYPIIKSGILGCVRQLASLFGEFNIRVNCLCPGAINGHIKGTKFLQDKNFIKKYSDKVPAGRLARPDEIAEACIFFSSKGASYITGQTIFVDGGYSII